MKESKPIHDILRVDQAVIDDLEARMERMSGKTGVIAELDADILSKVKEDLLSLGLTVNASAEDVYTALNQRVSRFEDIIAERSGNPTFRTPEGSAELINILREVTGSLSGMFLKEQKAVELLEKNPPQNILKALGYDSVAAMLAKEDLWEIFAALRFAEDMAWLNTVFFKPYEQLATEDFEERPIRMHVMDPKWTEIGRAYVGHKLHNISHLKEMGLIFVIPYDEPRHGQVIQVFTLVLHYFHEIKFYSDLFKQFAKDPATFTEHLTSALRGDIRDVPASTDRMFHWGIVQRYLAKDDPKDPRLFSPHVNPEALHWLRAERDFVRWGEQADHDSARFWRDRGYVGTYFQVRRNMHETLVSFDLVDNIVSYVRQASVDFKYLYHQQEALWNEIFMRYVGEEEMERMIVEGFNKGYISLSQK
jgi:hypothetical protein